MEVSVEIEDDIIEIDRNDLFLQHVPLLLVGIVQEKCEEVTNHEAYTECMKAKTYRDVKKFLDIPNIGPAMARDFHSLGLKTPEDLKKKDPFKLYQSMCRLSGVRQNPCVLDTYMAAIDFMNGAKAKPWWNYTKGRKKRYPGV